MSRYFSLEEGAALYQQQSGTKCSLGYARYLVVAYHCCRCLTKWMVLLYAALLLMISGFSEVAQAQQAALDVDDLKKRIASVEAMTALEASVRDEAVSLYRKALDNLEAAAGDRAKAREYVELLESAPARIAKLEQALEEASPPSREPAGDLDALEQQLLDEQAELLRLRRELESLRARQVAEQDVDLAERLARAFEQQAEAEAVLAAGAPDEPSPLAEARDALRRSAVVAANTNVEMLRQRQVSRDIRLELLNLEQRLLTRKVKRWTEYINNLQAAVNAARQAQAGDIAQRVSERAVQLEQATQALKTLAKENSQLARDTARVIERTELHLDELESLRKERSRIERYFDSITQQLAVSGASKLPALGAELQAQRQQLSHQQRQSYDTEAFDEEIALAQLMQLQLEDRLDTRAEAAATEGEESVDLALQLQREQTQLLQNAIKAYRRYIDALMSLRSENRALKTKYEEYQRLLDSRLFWIPSNAALTEHLWQGLGTELRELFAGKRWHDLVGAPQKPWFVQGLLGAAFFMAGLASLLFQRPFRRWLAQQAVNVGKANLDRFSRTLIALLLSLALALPGPLIMIAFAFWLSAGNEAFALQFRQALFNTAALWFLLNGFRQICRPNGLAEAHFIWPAEALQLIRQTLRWLLWVLVPITFFMSIAESSAGEHNVVTRLLFAIASVALAYAAHCVLQPGSALMRAIIGSHPRWRMFIRWLAYPLAVAAPLLLLLLSWYGYHFTALQIESKLFVSACLLAGLLVLDQLMLRAVSVLEKRMALDRLQARREAERAQSATRQATGEAGEGMPEKLDMPEYDMTAINRQSRAFVGMLVFLVAVFVLWFVWSETLPALGVLNETQLWQIQYPGTDTPASSVTLAQVLFAAVLLFLTYFGARNVSGALEVSVLRGLNLEAGTSYAVTTVIKYLIVIIGLTVSLSLLGAQWSKLQWLVAALGVGLGFGLQEIVANFISGLLILFERPIRVGDTITVGEHTGTVSRIRIRATTLTDWDRKEQIIPNKTFITEQLTNWTLSDPITRQIIKVGVAYGSDIELVHRLLTEAVERKERVVEDPPPAVFFVGFGDSSLDFEIRAFVKNMLDIMPLIHELHVDVEARFRENGIEIPFPQRDIWIRSAGAEAASDFSDKVPPTPE